MSSLHPKSERKMGKRSVYSSASAKKKLKSSSSKASIRKIESKPVIHSLLTKLLYSDKGYEESWDG